MNETKFLPESFINAQEALAKLPGIGPKSAQRMALSLLRWNHKEIENLALAIEGLNQIQKCLKCQFIMDHSGCRFCNDLSRQDSASLCVVESVVDVLAIEQSGQFFGRYFILGGVLNPVIGIGVKELGLNKMQELIHEEKISKIILALGSSIEADATCGLIREYLPEEITMHRIGFGMPIGSHLHYLDALTIAKALQNTTSVN